MHTEDLGSVPQVWGPDTAGGRAPRCPTQCLKRSFSSAGCPTLHPPWLPFSGQRPKRCQQSITGWRQCGVPERANFLTPSPTSAPTQPGKPTGCGQLRWARRTKRPLSPPLGLCKYLSPTCPGSPALWSVPTRALPTPCCLQKARVLPTLRALTGLSLNFEGPPLPAGSDSPCGLWYPRLLHPGGAQGWMD